MSKKLYIKKDNHLLTLLDEEDIQDKLDEKANTSDVEDLAEQIDDIVAGDLDLTTYAKTANLATVATSGSYNDLNNKPTLSSLGGDITITQQGTPETGYAATYVLKQGSTTLSPKINIPKDQFVQSASLVTVGSTPNTLESTNNLSTGDVYIKMVINTENTETGATTLAIPVNELIDTYNADNTTLQLNNNTFSVKNGGITLEKLSSSLQTTINNKANSSDVPSASSTTPKADTDGGKVGSGTTWAKADHQHPLSNAYATSGHNHDGTYLKSYTPPTGSTSQAGIVQLEDSYSSTSTTKAATPNAVKAAYELANGKLDLTGGTMTGNIKIPSEYESTSGATGNIPFAGSLDKASQSITDTLPTLKSLVATIKTNDDTWWNILSMRHKNGSNDGNRLGLYLKSLLTGDGDLIWNKQYGSNGIWVGERTILDSNNYSTYAASNNHTHTKLVSNGALPSTATQFADYKEEGYYTCGAGISANITDKPFTGNYTCIIENKHYDSGGFIQFCYKFPGTALTEIYYRKHTDNSGWTAWSKIANINDIPTKTSDLVNDGDGTNVFVKNNDSKLSDNRNPLMTWIGSSSTTTKDLNNFTSAGFYYCKHDTNESPYVSNQPLSSNQKSFFMLVETWNSTTYVKQTLTYYNTGDTYIRTKTSSSSWTAWKLQINEGNISTYASPTTHTHNKSDINFTAISSGNDLNSFVTNGYHSCGSNTSTSVTNKPAMFPSGGANFVLVVEQFGQQIFQTMEMISSVTANSMLYFRSKTASGWSEWRECYSGQKAYYVATEENPLDLNDFIEKGIFTFAKSGNGNGKLSNSPVFGYALHVENQEYSAGNIIQIAKTVTTNKNNNRIFYRVYTGNAWASSGAWTELAAKKSKTVTVNYTDGTTETINFLIE